jgi:hypothetical protein
MVDHGFEQTENWPRTVPLALPANSRINSEAYRAMMARGGFGESAIMLLPIRGTDRNTYPTTTY